jgi:apolipoprotein N-acyltransferase
VSVFSILSARSALPVPSRAWILPALLLGAAFSASFAPLGWWWAQVPTVAALVALLLRAPSTGAGVWRSGLFGGAFAFGWLASSWWWLHISLHQYGGLPWILAALAVAALAAAMSAYLALACAAFVAWRSGRCGPDTLLFAGLWLLAELARGTFFTGFPWSASGYAHTTGPLAALAPWVGSYGIGAVAAAMP